MRKAKWVLNVSYYTRDTVAEIFPEFIPKLIVVHSGLDPAMFDDPPDDFELVGAEFQLTAPYLLYYGSTRPNKNLPNLLRGFAHYVRESGDDRTELVMILKKDRFFRDLPRIVRSEGIADRVRFLDQVSPGEQRTILTNALGFLFPSKYEGFGFPALEALANRVPLLAAKSGALEEVCGDAAVYVDPDDVASIGRGIELMLESPRRTEARRERGRARAEQFSWKETASRVLDVYRLLC
jgi:glycosyltransferase involved in cell wall biosynthesis